MAGIIISGSGGGGFINPSNSYMPVRSAGQFVDSNVENKSDLYVRSSLYNSILGEYFEILQTKESGLFFINIGTANNTRQALKIDFDNNENTLEAREGVNNLRCSSLFIEADLVEFDGLPLLSNSAGGTAAKYLCITVNGNPYKLNLLNP